MKDAFKCAKSMLKLIDYDLGRRKNLGKISVQPHTAIMHTFCNSNHVHATAGLTVKNQPIFSPLSRLDYFKRSYLYLTDGSVQVEDHQLEKNVQKKTKRNKLAEAPTTPCRLLSLPCSPSAVFIVQWGLGRVTRESRDSAVWRVFTGSLIFFPPLHMALMGISRSCFKQSKTLCWSRESML